MASLIVLGKSTKQVFATEGSIPHLEHTYPGEIFYVMGVFAGIIFWGCSILWLGVAAVMITLARPFPFNMGWWGFIFPLGKWVSKPKNSQSVLIPIVSGIFSLLTIVLGEELESKFFKVLSCVS